MGGMRGRWDGVWGRKSCKGREGNKVKWHKKKEAKKKKKKKKTPSKNFSPDKVQLFFVRDVNQPLKIHPPPSNDCRYLKVIIAILTSLLYTKIALIGDRYSGQEAVRTVISLGVVPWSEGCLLLLCYQGVCTDNVITRDIFWIPFKEINSIIGNQTQMDYIVFIFQLSTLSVVFDLKHSFYCSFCIYKVTSKSSTRSVSVKLLLSTVTSSRHTLRTLLQ